MEAWPGSFTSRQNCFSLLICYWLIRCNKQLILNLEQPTTTDVWWTNAYYVCMFVWNACAWILCSNFFVCTLYSKHQYGDTGNIHFQIHTKQLLQTRPLLRSEVERAAAFTNYSYSCGDDGNGNSGGGQQNTLTVRPTERTRSGLYGCGGGGGGGGGGDDEQRVMKERKLWRQRQ